ncbi:MAG: hypothetical protein AAF718_15805 [Pseudomonadota bacterium]
MTDTHPYNWTLKHGPIGVWQGVALDGSTAMIAAKMTFRSDGTGHLHQEGRLSGVHDMEFQWRLEGPGALALIPLEGADPDLPDEWDRFTFTLGWLHEAEQQMPILQNDGADGLYPAEGFYEFEAPLQLVSRVPDASD